MGDRLHGVILRAAAIVVIVEPCEFALADTSLSLYTGSSFTLSSDIHVQQPATGSDATFKGVTWDAKPFKSPIYYGIRLNHFFEHFPHWGLGLDFTHYKVFAETDRVVPVSGTFNGMPVNESAPLNQRVQRFNISHGVNLIALNTIYRWSFLPTESFTQGRLQPYAGVGLVYFLLHPENTVNNKNNNESYQGSGFGYQVLGGLHYGLTRNIGLFAETKFSSGEARVDTADQGRAETTLHTFHLLAGISLGF